ncbi:MAG: orotidine-5'-phosphate decarboxylase [Salibacteraceae bacterium]
MNRKELVSLINKKQSFLCVGLDTDPDKLPTHLPKTAQGMLAFNKAIIDATLPHTVSYKLNIAFYEAMGVEGWRALKETIDYIPKDEAFIIADAKRGDIGNTASQYAKAFFVDLNADAITVNPYMGKDSVTPFLDYKDKWSIVLGLTSNPGAEDVELQVLENGRYVFEETMDRIAKYGNDENLMFVVGATKSEYFERLRAVSPNHFYLVPGVGAQGGKLEDLKPLMTSDCGLLVNSSRGIIYASSGEDFAIKAKVMAESIQGEMSYMLA